MLPLLGILLASLVSINLSAQTLKISGTIVNQGNSTPVPGASVAVKNAQRFAITDETGKFTIDASTGDVLVITMIGYLKKEVVDEFVVGIRLSIGPLDEILGRQT